MGDLPTADDLRDAADFFRPARYLPVYDGLSIRVRNLADALDAGTVRLVRADDEPPEGWRPSSLWYGARNDATAFWWLPVSLGLARVSVDGDGCLWCLPHGYPDDAVHRAPLLRVAQYRAEAALRAAGEQVPR